MNLLTFSDDDLLDELSRREQIRALASFGPMNPELARKYARIIAQKSGETVPDDLLDKAKVKSLYVALDYRGQVGIGFEVSFGDRYFARQAVVFSYWLSKQSGAREQVEAALARYFRDPDCRLVVGENYLTGNELAVQVERQPSGEVVVTIPAAQA